MDFIDKIEEKIYTAKKSHIRRKVVRAKVQAKRREELEKYEKELSGYQPTPSKTKGSKAKAFMANAGKQTEALFAGTGKGMTFGGNSNEFSSFGFGGSGKQKKGKHNNSLFGGF